MVSGQAISGVLMRIYSDEHVAFIIFTLILCNIVFQHPVA
jgi:hypothetical protein